MALPTVSQGTAGQVYTAAAHNVIADNLNQLGNGYTYVETVYFTSSGTFTKATYPYLRAIRVKCQGAGGGGPGAGTVGAGAVQVGSSGSGGAYAESFITDIAGLSASVTVTVGAGGVAGTGNANGSNGGTTSFGATVSANGGLGGATFGGLTPFQSINSTGGATTATGDLVVRGESSNAVTVHNAGRQISLNGGNSFLGVGGSGLSTTTGVNGVSGVRGGGGSSAINCENQSTSRTGGTGGSGIVIVELYA